MYKEMTKLYHVGNKLLLSLALGKEINLESKEAEDLQEALYAIDDGKYQEEFKWG